MSLDATAAIATAYGQAFVNGSTGRFSGAAQAGVANMKAGGAGTSLGGEPCTMEAWIEMGAAMEAASARGQDPQAALAVAAVTGASFIREVATGVYESDMGLWAPDAGKLLRYRRELDADHVAVFVNITPEFASTVGTRDIATTAQSVRVSSLADAILVSGPMAGAEPSVDAVREAKRGCGDETPVFANTGVKSSNVKDFLAVADGAIVGSDLKVDGGTWNPVDPERASRFMTEVRAVRDSL
jgi:membrane complex biogenesis BtpA family protein